MHTCFFQAKCGTAEVAAQRGFIIMYLAIMAWNYVSRKGVPTAANWMAHRYGYLLLWLLTPNKELRPQMTSFNFRVGAQPKNKTIALQNKNAFQ